MKLNAARSVPTPGSWRMLAPVVAACVLVGSVTGQLATAPPAVAAPPSSDDGVTEPAAPEPAVEVLEDGSIPALTTETSNSVAMPDGTIQTTITPTAINYQETDGTWAAIDTNLVAAESGDGLQSAAGPVQVSLPAEANGPVTVATQQDGQPARSVTLELVDAAAVPVSAVEGATAAELSMTQAEAGSSAAAVDVLPDTTIAWSATTTGVKESIVLASADAPRRFMYRLSLSDGLTPILEDDGSITVSDGDAPVLTLPAPFADDAAGVHTTDVDYDLQESDSGWSLITTVDDAWLDADDRQFPVIVDPSVLWSSPAGNAGSNRACTISSAIPVSQCTNGYAQVNVGRANGVVSRGLFNFGDLATLPAGSEIVAATLNLAHVKSTEVTTPIEIEARIASKRWTGATWTTTGTGTNWTTAGGDMAATASARFIVPVGNPPIGSVPGYAVDVTGAMIDSATGRTENTGFFLRATSESQAGMLTFGGFDDYAYCTSGGSGYCDISYLTMTYRPAFGLSGAKAQYTQAVNDTQNVNINIASGALVATSRELTFASAGPSSTLSRYFSGAALLGGWQLALPSVTSNAMRVSYTDDTGSLYTFTGPGNGTFATAPGIQATVTRASDGTVTVRRDPDRLIETFRPDGTIASQQDLNGNARTFTYAAAGSSGYSLRPTSITDASGRSVTVNYIGSGAAMRIGSLSDSAGRTVTYTYTNDLVTQVTGADGGRTKYSYDSSRRLTRVTSPAGRETTFVYDSLSRVTSMTQVTNPISGGGAGNSGPTTTFAYSSSAAPGGGVPGGQTILTDARGNATTYVYDGAGRVSQVTDALNHAQSVTYSPHDDVVTAADAMPAANTVRYTYSNAAGGYRPTSVSIPTGASASARYPTSGSGPGRYLPTSVTDPQGNGTTLAYDTAGNSTSRISGGVTTSTTYNPPAGQATTCSGGGKPGQPCTQTDGRGGVTTYTYDAAGNLMRVTPPSGAIKPTSYTYDSVGRIQTKTDGKGQVTSYVYDGANRATQVRFNGAADCGTASNCQAYTYDADGNLTSRVDAGGTTTYSYDQRGQLIGQTTTTRSGGGSKASTLTYDAVGNLTAYTEAGATTTYGYDAGNNLTSLAEPGGSCVGTVSLCTRYEYNANDVRTKITYPGGTTVNFLQIDASNRPLQYRATTNSGAVLMDFTYSFAAAGADSGLVQTRSDATVAGTAVQSYAYDGLNRLTRATERIGTTTSVQWTYCYDANGNRTYDSTSTAASVLCPGVSGGPAATYSYDATNALTARTGFAAFTYDNNGAELTGGGSTTRTAGTWNPRGQLTALTTNGTAHSFGYTGESNKERVSFDGSGYQNTALGVTAQSGTGAHTVIREPNGTPVAIRISGASYYFIADRQGSTVAIVDGTGVKKNSYTYDPYGASRAKTELIPNPYQYIGGQFDAATGLYHLQNRYYDPSIGRFTQPDPSGQESNTYTYTSCSPVNASDPTGLIGFFCGLAVASFVLTNATNLTEIVESLNLGLSLTRFVIAIIQGRFTAQQLISYVSGLTGFQNVLEACS